MSRSHDLDPAPRGRRIGGRTVDIVVAGWLLAVTAVEIDGRLLGGDLLARRPLAAVTPDGTRLAVIAALVVVATEIVPTAYWGRTPGKAMLGLRCVDIDTGVPPGLIRSVFRGMLLHAWVAIPVLGLAAPRRHHRDLGGRFPRARAARPAGGHHGRRRRAPG